LEITAMNYRSISILLLAGFATLANTAQAGEICRPQLAVKQVRLSELKDLQRNWTAVLNVDATRCAATSGHFAISIVREKENAPPLEFDQMFVWRTNDARTGQVEASLDLWIDEVVQEYAVVYIAPCGFPD
jgi:hypothetical protein